MMTFTIKPLPLTSPIKTFIKASSPQKSIVIPWDRSLDTLSNYRQAALTLHEAIRNLKGNDDMPPAFSTELFTFNNELFAFVI